MNNKKRRILLALENISNAIMSIIPKDKIVVFSATRGYEGSPKYLYNYLRNKDIKYKVFWITNDKKFYKNKKKEDKNLIYSYSLSGIIIYCKASIYISGNSIKVFGKIFSILKNRVLIQTGHGIPIKTIGWEAEKFYSNWEINRQADLAYNNNNTYVVVSGIYEKEALKKCFKVKEDRFIEIGQPRNHIFNELSIKSKLIKSKLPNILKENKIILYAPTWRGYGEFKLFPFKDKNLNQLNEFLVSKNICLIIKIHPFEKINLDELKNLSNIINFSNEWDLDNQEIQVITDIMITDFSSIYCDYINTLKPIIFIHKDIKEYKLKRGLMAEGEKIFPGPKIETQLNLIDEILYFMNNKEYYLEERKYTQYLFNGFESYNSLQKLDEFICRILEI